MLVKMFGFIALLLFLSACGGNAVEIEPSNGADYEAKVYDPDNALPEAEYTPVYVPAPTPTPTPTPRPATPPPFLPLDHDCDPYRASVICHTCAALLINMMEARFDWDDGEMWGVHLHGPFMFACPVTRQAAANRPDLYGVLARQPEGVYTGILPEGTLIGNTATWIFGEEWGMMTWTLVQQRLPDVAQVVGIMAHELFHAWQRELFIGQPAGFQPLFHMHEADARVQVRIEMNALVHALRSGGAARREAAYIALAARNTRQQNAQITDLEIVMEMQEGTAVYTEMRVMMHEMSDKMDWMEDYIERFYRGRSMHTFGYVTGALYGLLLDAFNVNWQTDLHWNTDLAHKLRIALGFDEFTLFTPFNALDLSRFNYEEIRAEEEAWVAALAQREAEARRIFALPLLRVNWFGDFIFGDDAGSMYIQGMRFLNYGTLIFESTFGRLYINDGFLWLGGTPMFWEVTTENMVKTPTGATGLGWELILNPGYYIHAGDGYYEVRG